MRLFDEADDLELLRCGEPHVWSPPSAIILMEWRAPPQLRDILRGCRQSGPQAAWQPGSASPPYIIANSNDPGRQIAMQRKRAPASRNFHQLASLRVEMLARHSRRYADADFRRKTGLGVLQCHVIGIVGSQGPVSLRDLCVGTDIEKTYASRTRCEAGRPWSAQEIIRFGRSAIVHHLSDESRAARIQSDLSRRA